MKVYVCIFNKDHVVMSNSVCLTTSHFLFVKQYKIIKAFFKFQNLKYVFNYYMYDEAFT